MKQGPIAQYGVPALFGTPLQWKATPARWLTPFPGIPAYSAACS